MCEITTVCSGKGGVGKSIFSSLLGKKMCKNGYKVLIIELNKTSSSLDINLGCENSIIYNINDVLNKNCKPNDAIIETKLAKNLYFIPCMNNIKEINVNNLIGLLNGLSTFFNHIIIDTNINSILPKLSEHITNGVFVVNADPSSIRNAVYLLNTIDDKYINKYKFVVNNLHLEIFKNNYFKSIDDIIDILNIQLLGVIPNDISLNNGMFIGSKISSETINIYDAICSRLLGKYKPLLIK